MSGDLYPTPTRLADLRDVARQRVVRLPSGETRRYYLDGTYRTLNARMGEMEAAGWVQVGEETGRIAEAHWRFMELADAGQAVLDSHPDVPS